MSNIKRISLDLKTLIEEHQHLLGLFQMMINELQKEYDEQSKELAEYQQIYGSGFNQDKVRYVMEEFKRGQLFTPCGRQVTNPKQAIAIALSEARKM
jgi:hypothetical protein